MRIERGGDDRVVIGALARQLPPDVQRDLAFISATLNLRAGTGVTPELPLQLIQVP